MKKTENMADEEVFLITPEAMSADQIKEEREYRRKLILSRQTEHGGWTKSQLEEWGVPWPPPPGWRVNLILYGIPYKPQSVDGGDEMSQDGRVRNDPKGKPNV